MVLPQRADAVGGGGGRVFFSFSVSGGVRRWAVSFDSYIKGTFPPCRTQTSPPLLIFGSPSPIYPRAVMKKAWLIP